MWDNADIFHFCHLYLRGTGVIPRLCSPTFYMSIVLVVRVWWKFHLFQALNWTKKVNVKTINFDTLSAYLTRNSRLSMGHHHPYVLSRILNLSQFFSLQVPMKLAKPFKSARIYVGKMLRFMYQLVKVDNNLWKAMD